MFGARLDVHTLLYAGAAIVVGFQAVVFAVLARVYAASEGFLPDSRLVEPRARVVLARAPAFSSAACSCSPRSTLSVIAFVRWDDSSFKHLNYPDSLRLAIPAAVALMLGVQTILSSFFLSVLGIKQDPARRRRLIAVRRARRPGAARKGTRSARR